MQQTTATTNASPAEHGHEVIGSDQPMPAIRKEGQVQWVEETSGDYWKYVARKGEWVYIGCFARLSPVESLKRCKFHVACNRKAAVRGFHSFLKKKIDVCFSCATSNEYLS